MTNISFLLWLYKTNLPLIKFKTVPSMLIILYLFSMEQLVTEFVTNEAIWNKDKLRKESYN